MSFFNQMCGINKKIMTTSKRDLTNDRKMSTFETPYPVYMQCISHMGCGVCNVGCGMWNIDFMACRCATGDATI